MTTKGSENYTVTKGNVLNTEIDISRTRWLTDLSQKFQAHLKGTNITIDVKGVAALYRDDYSVTNIETIFLSLRVSQVDSFITQRVDMVVRQALITDGIGRAEILYNKSDKGIPSVIQVIKIK